MKTILASVIILISLFLTFQDFEDKEVNIHNEQLSNKFLSKNIPIIDIRTKDEWKDTGIVKNSTLLTFYNKDKSFDSDKFLSKIDELFDKKANLQYFVELETDQIELQDF